MRRLVALVAAVAGLAVPPAPALGQPLPQAFEGPGVSHLRLASQTSWVAPGQELVLRLVVSTSERPADVEVAIAVYRRIANRTEFARTLSARPRSAPVSVTATPLSELAVDPGGAVVVRLPVEDTSEPADRPALRLRDRGVYPVRVELREVGGGDSLAELVTHLVYATPPEPGGLPLGVALVLPVHAPPAIQPDGSRRLAPRRAEAIDALARSLEAQPDVPVTIDPTPETLAALESSPRGADHDALAVLARAALGRQVTAAPYVPIALQAFLGAGLDEEATAQLQRGIQVVDRTLGTRPDPRTWIADADLDEAAVDGLRRRQVDRLVVPEPVLEPVDLNVTLAQPFELDLASIRRPAVLAADPGLSAHFAPSADPVLAAHRLLADLAVIYYDSPGRTRAVVALPPNGWQPTSAFLETLLEGVASSPVLDGVTLDTVFANVPTATTDDGAPMVRRLVAPAPASSLPAAAVRAARRQLQSFATMLEAGNALDDNIEELLLVAQGAEVRPRQRLAYLDGVEARIAAQTRLIEVPQNRSITLTARTGEIPVTILSRAGYRVQLQVQVASDKLTFPGGAVRVVDLSRRNTTERFSVQARASGAFPLRVSLVSPDGGLVLGRTRFTVRSTAASGVGVLLSASAGAFLLVWWARHLARGRRNRRLVPG